MTSTTTTAPTVTAAMATHGPVDRLATYFVEKFQEAKTQNELATFQCSTQLKFEAADKMLEVHDRDLALLRDDMRSFWDKAPSLFLHKFSAQLDAIAAARSEKHELALSRVEQRMGDEVKNLGEQTSELSSKLAVGLASLRGRLLDVTQTAKSGQEAAADSLRRSEAETHDKIRRLEIALERSQHEAELERSKVANAANATSSCQREHAALVTRADGADDRACQLEATVMQQSEKLASQGDRLARVEQELQSLLQTLGRQERASHDLQETVQRQQEEIKDMSTLCAETAARMTAVEQRTRPGSGLAQHTSPLSSSSRTPPSEAQARSLRSPPIPGLKQESPGAEEDRTDKEPIPNSTRVAEAMKHSKRQHESAETNQQSAEARALLHTEPTPPPAKRLRSTYLTKRPARPPPSSVPGTQAKKEEGIKPLSAASGMDDKLPRSIDTKRRPPSHPVAVGIGQPSRTTLTQQSEQPRHEMGRSKGPPGVKEEEDDKRQAQEGALEKTTQASPSHSEALVTAKARREAEEKEKAEKKRERRRENARARARSQRGKQREKKTTVKEEEEKVDRKAAVQTPLRPGIKQEKTDSDDQDYVDNKSTGRSKPSARLPQKHDARHKEEEGGDRKGLAATTSRDEEEDQKPRKPIATSRSRIQAAQAFAAHVKAFLSHYNVEKPVSERRFIWNFLEGIPDRQWAGFVQLRLLEAYPQFVKKSSRVRAKHPIDFDTGLTWKHVVQVIIDMQKKGRT